MRIHLHFYLPTFIKAVLLHVCAHGYVHLHKSHSLQSSDFVLEPIVPHASICRLTCILRGTYCCSMI